MPSLSEAPNGGARALGYLGLFQVTRCKSETASGRYRKNGYVLKNTKHQAPSTKHQIYRFREQARSYSGLHLRLNSGQFPQICQRLRVECNAVDLGFGTLLMTPITR